MKKSKGFTIIELLVVVAIIAVLAAIVLVNVTEYVNRGKNAAIKGNLNSILTNGSKYFDDPLEGNGTYGTTGAQADVTSGDNFCTTSYYVNAAQAIADIGEDSLCSIDATYTAWCACASLKGGGSFCVDSTGSKIDSSNDCDTTQCSDSGACI